MSGELHVQNLGKSYRQWGSEWRRVASWFAPAIRPREEHWVLKDVTLSVGAGETVGIVGQNGAGKSTLLKIITGTTRPTEGRVELRGRVAAILELGMGFNADLTGRQNAFHSAGLMGHSQAEIQRTMPEIESFAEVGAYFDQPVRTYSSGMQMRVAFSVATAFQPDMLIVDEALSVGDSYFQHKSFDRIRQFSTSGVSIMLVTHGMGDLRALCDRVILLDKGRMIKDGKPDEVVDLYNALIAEKENTKLSIEQRRAGNGWLLTKSGTGEARVRSLQLFDIKSGNEVACVDVGQPVTLKLEVSIHAYIPRLVIGLMVRDQRGHVVWGTNTWHTQQVLHELKENELVVLSMSFACVLGPGSYAVTAALTSSDSHITNNFEWTDNVFVFDVVNLNKPTFAGSTWLDATLVVERRL